MDKRYGANERQERVNWAVRRNGNASGAEKKWLSGGQEKRDDGDESLHRMSAYGGTRVRKRERALLRAGKSRWRWVAKGKLSEMKHGQVG